MQVKIANYALLLQVRVTDLERRATRSYQYHSSTVKSLAMIDSHVFVSAGEDGTVRKYDVRENADTSSTSKMGLLGGYVGHNCHLPSLPPIWMT